MKVKQVAEKMLDKNSKERKIAEKMFGIKFEEMTPEQRVLAAECIAAFNIQLMEEQKLLQVGLEVPLEKGAGQ